jgi:hypothetical protein
MISGEIMPRESIRVNWDRSQLRLDINPILNKYENYLLAKGYGPSSITRYLDNVKFYLFENKSVKPTVDDAVRFRADLLRSNRKRTTINLYSAAIKQFHKMYGEDVDMPYLKLSNKPPYFLTSDDVLKILSVINNLKHCAMISVSFYCILRAVS